MGLSFFFLGDERRKVRCAPARQHNYEMIALISELK
jgi:hypothetical protein